MYDIALKKIDRIGIASCYNQLKRTDLQISTCYSERQFNLILLESSGAYNFSFDWTVASSGSNNEVFVLCSRTRYGTSNVQDL